MSRIALLGAIVLASAVGCSKAPKNESPKSATGSEVVAVPGSDLPTKGPGAGAPTSRGTVESAQAMDSGMTLKPDEGTVSVEMPADAKAGTETTAKVILTPGPKFKVNFEFPTKLTFEAANGVTLAKAELKAGGPSQTKGDAEKFEEKQLAFMVKLTPTAAGNHTINGAFKFAVCDKEQCLPKRETIAIQVAAK